MTQELIVHHLFRQARERPDAAACWTRVAEQWRPTSWTEYVDEVRRTARALMAAGLEAGDRVAVIGFNRPEWTVFALGAMTAGCVPVGIYTTNSAPELRYVVDHSGAKVLLVENADQLRKVAAVRAEMPALERVVTMDDDAPDGSDAVFWPEFLALSAEVDDGRLDERVAGIGPGDLATLIYTSGTTGTPKGVMLSHDNVVRTAEIGIEMFALGPEDSNLSYLPLSHIAEQMFTVFIPCASGGTIYYAESQERVAANLAEVQPTVVFGVPRVWEKMQAGVLSKLAEARGSKAALAGWAQAVGRRVTAHRAVGTPLRGLLSLRHALADRLVLSKVRAKLGLSRARVCVSGAAPIGKEVLEFFAGFGILLREVYGQSEGSGPTTCNQEGATRFGTVGPPIPRVEVALGEDGEVLVRGPNVFLGYFDDAAATAETLIDGWLHSGDLGTLDEDGFLTITGRKKDILITSGGKNIAPRAIEESLKRIELVSEAVAIGERRRFVSALLVLDEDAVDRFASERGLSADSVRDSPELVQFLQTAIEASNEAFARVEQVRAFRVLPEPFSLAEGELTPTLKLRRHVIEERYRSEIEDMYA